MAVKLAVQDISQVFKNANISPLIYDPSLKGLGDLPSGVSQTLGDFMGAAMLSAVPHRKVMSPRLREEMRSMTTPQVLIEAAKVGDIQVMIKAKKRMDDMEVNIDEEIQNTINQALEAAAAGYSYDIIVLLLSWGAKYYMYLYDLLKNNRIDLVRELIQKHWQFDKTKYDNEVEYKEGVDDFLDYAAGFKHNDIFTLTVTKAGDDELLDQVLVTAISGDNYALITWTLQMGAIVSVDLFMDVISGEYGDVKTMDLLLPYMQKNFEKSFIADCVKRAVNNKFIDGVKYVMERCVSKGEILRNAQIRAISQILMPMITPADIAAYLIAYNITPPVAITTLEEQT